ncbi:MAG TPA: glycosyltransferase family 2 protein [Vicinamibacterales bacterium]|nr:glycosyltransferase family 2 protein [Vicinamibacterales bacterium]
MPSGLDVIIVSFNTRALTLAALASLFNARPAGLRRVFVVDNASTDGSAEAVHTSFPAVDVLALPTNLGFGAANNQALRRAEAPLVLLLNSDTVVPPGALDTLVERLEATGAVAAGPRLADAEGRPEVSFGRMLSPWAELVQQSRVRAARRSSASARRRIDRLLAAERDVDWVSGACLLVRRDAALAAGFFDERYFLYEEDVDFCAALRARGGRILFTPRATVTHLVGRSGRPTDAGGASHYDRSHLAFYEKHRPAWAPWLRLWLRLRGRGIR